nr:hypothetical protein [Bacteroidota bacterium]
MKKHLAVLITITLLSKLVLSQKLDTRIVDGAVVVRANYSSAMAFARLSKDDLNKQLLNIYPDHGIDDNFVKWYGTGATCKSGVHGVFLQLDGSIIIMWSADFGSTLSLLIDDMDSFNKKELCAI